MTRSFTQPLALPSGIFIFSTIFLFLPFILLAQSGDTQNRLLETADSLRLGGQYDEAIGEYRQVLREVKNKKEAAFWQKAYWGIGESFRKKALPDSAIFWLNEGVALGEQYDSLDPYLSGITHKSLGLTFFRSDKEKAAFEFEKAGFEFEKMGKAGLESLCKVLHNQAICLYRLGQYTKALKVRKYELKQRKLLAQAGAEDKICRCFSEIGNCYYRLWKIEIARSYYERAIDCAERYGPQNKILGFKNNLIATDMELGLYRQAIESLQELNQETQNLQDLRILELNYYNLGDYYLKTGDYASGERYLLKALSIAQKEEYQDNYAILRIFNRLGTAAYLQGDHDKAENYFLAILDHQQVEPFFLISVYQNLTQIYIQRKQWEKAEKFLKQEGHLLNTSQGWDSGYIQFSMGIITIGKGDFDKGIKLAQKGIEWKKDFFGKKNPRVIQNYIDLGMCLEGIGKLKEALSLYQEALQILGKNYSPENILETPSSFESEDYFLIIRILQRKATTLHQMAEQKNLPFLKAAFHTATTAQSYVDSLRFSRQSEENRYKLSHSLKRINQLMGKIVHELEDDPEAGQFARKLYLHCQRTKSALLQQSIGANASLLLAGLPDSLKIKEQALRYALIKQKALLDEENDPEKSNALKAEIADLKLKADRFSQTIKETFPGYYELQYHPIYLKVEEVQNQLLSDQALIEYFVGDSSIYIFLLSSQQFQYIQQPITETFRNNLHTLHRQFHEHSHTLLSDQQKQERYKSFTRAAYQLYGTLLEPFLELANPGQLIIIPDGKLGYLPFHLLLKEPASREQMQRQDYRSLSYLFKHYPIQLEYSAALLFREDLKNLQSKPETSYSGFAPVYEGKALTTNRMIDSLSLRQLYPEVARSGLVGLTFNRPEVERAAAHFPGSKIFTAESATESNFKQYGPEANILHLAMHGLTNDENPLFSQLVFTQSTTEGKEDGFLHAYELYNTRLKAELAVLSACNTGSGALADGEGILSLARAFKYAGCPNIAMSLWKADDEVTSQIMEVFFAQLKEGKGKSESLRLAQINYLQNEAPANKTHPYYWAPFVMIGDDEPLRSVRKGWPWWGWVGLIIGAGLIGWGVWRRRRAITP